MSHEPDEIEREERAIYVVIGLACLPVVIAAFIHGGALDGGASISLLMVVLALGGLSGLAKHNFRRKRAGRIPRAQLHHPSSRSQ
ncbi:MAG: hypothetical protein SFX73_16830 [Kofleriaceae bacterium]|nr:hypothetical protein [Kofleriaceae bacterium]